MKELIVIIVYLGDSWPPWFSLFLKTCEKNPWMDWKIFTNIAPIKSPSNVSFINFTLEDFKELSRKKLDVNPSFTDPYKLCDFKITFGKMFEDHIKDYKYLACGDIDVLYGNLEKFIAPLIPYQYDLISLAYNRFTGHFGLLKNNIEVINKFKYLENWKSILESSDVVPIDEYPFAKLFNNRDCFFQDLDPFDRFIYRGRRGFSFSEGVWDNGVMYVRDKEEMIEVPIFHFYLLLNKSRKIALWKKRKRIIYVSPEEKKWRITSIGIIPEK